MIIREFLVLFLSVLMVGPVSADDSFFTDEGFVLYDDFSDCTISSDLWIGLQTFDHVGDESGEGYVPWNSLDLQRMINVDPVRGKKKGKATDGTLHLINTLEGAVAKNTIGVSRSRIGYSLKERDIVGVGGRLGFHGYETYGDMSYCSGNARSRLRLIGRLFNAEYESPEPDDYTGEIMAYVALERRANFTEEGMRIIAVVFKCVSSDCWDIQVGYAHIFGFVDPNEDVEITMEFTGSLFIFRYGTDMVDFENPWQIIGPALRGGGIALQAFVDTPVCESEPAYAYIDAFADEVFVKYDD